VSPQNGQANYRQLFTSLQNRRIAQLFLHYFDGKGQAGQRRLEKGVSSG
jgi:hypothetical protein